MSAAPKTYTQKFTVYRHDGDHLGNVKPVRCCAMPSRSPPPTPKPPG